MLFRSGRAHDVGSEHVDHRQRVRGRRHAVEVEAGDVRGVPEDHRELLGEVLDIMVEHGEMLCSHLGADRGIRDFRKHTSWYLTGYPVGGAMRRSFSEISSLDELRRLADSLDRSIEIVPGGERISRGHTNGPIKVQLPENYLADRDDMTIPDDGDVMALSGG